MAARDYYRGTYQQAGPRAYADFHYQPKGVRKSDLKDAGLSSTNVRKTFKCPECTTPVAFPALVQTITFPEDSDAIIQLLEGTLNVATCSVCQTRTPVLVTLVAVNLEGQAIAVVPEGSDHENELIKLAAAGKRELQIGRNYYDLYRYMAPWLNSYLVPIANSLFTGKYADLPRDQQVSLFTPLFIRVFKGHIDGNIDIKFQVGGGLDAQKAKELIGKFYSIMVGEQLYRLVLEAARTKTLATLPEMVENHVPKSCITAEVLEKVIERCRPWQDPYEDPNNFMVGFRQEYLNAVAHAYADVVNPRTKIWIDYLFTLWGLGKDERVFLDPQFTLPKATVHRTVRFEDLWDIVAVGTLNQLNETGQQPETMRAMSEFFGHYGFESEYEKALGSGYRVHVSDKETANALQNAFEKTLADQLQFNQSADASRDLGGLVAGSINFLLQSSLKEQALDLLRKMLARAKEVGDETASLAIVAYTVEYLNIYDLYGESEAIIPQAVEIAIKNAETLDASLLIHFWNEVGNTFRYRHHYESALDAYEIVAGLLEAAPDNQTTSNNKSTLNRNLGIVYRNTGRYGKALTLLRNEAAANSSDPEFQHNLASLYFHLNRYPEALQYLNRAIDMAKGEMHARSRANYFISRSAVKQELGDSAGSLQDLQLAAEITSETETQRQLRIALLALKLKEVPESSRSFVEASKNQIIAAIESDDLKETPVTLSAMLINLGIFLLRAGQVREAELTIRPMWEWLSSRCELSWEMDHVIAWLEYQTGNYERSWHLIETALRKIDEAVPSLEEASFAESWMIDKEELQMHLASMTLDLFDRGIITAKELIPLYEFMNGKEISARIKNQGSSRRTTVSNFPQERKSASERAKVFFFIETDTMIRLGVTSNGTADVDLVDGFSLDRKQVLEIREKTRDALKAANPADLSSLEAKLKSWNELADQLGLAVADRLDGDEHVCLLPGRTLTGLPLHLMMLPNGQTLIERHPVSYAPNLTVLLSENSQSGGVEAARATVITVTKSQDSVDFRNRALTTSKKIIATLEKENSVEWIKQEAADRESIRRALENSNEVVFVCHGTTAGVEKGYGICISDGADLPPTLLPVLDFPDLSRFVLTWRDINDLDRSPTLVISIACSSGLTNIGSGGVRHGLEQSLFGSGTATIVSPLWDVEQKSALAWLCYFISARSEDPQSTLAGSFRSACLRVKDEYPHPFFWAPFIINGSFS